MKRSRLIIVSLICLLVGGCSTGDKFDQLKVVDGEGRILLLKHNIGDTYFVQDISTPPATKNGEANKRLEQNIKKSNN